MRYSITNFASTILKCFNVEKEETMNDALPIVNDILKDGKPIEKCLVFSVDAVPEYIISEYSNMFECVKKFAPYEVLIEPVMPSITPECYGAMFSGAYPTNNGLPEYKEPKIENGVAQPSLSVIPYTETLVDAGKKVAVVTCDKGCIQTMLYGRKADVYAIPNDDDDAIFEKACQLVKENYYDFIFVYQFDYDHTMHVFSPKGEKSLEMLNHINNKFEKICKIVENTWKNTKNLIVYNCDHGAHATGEFNHQGAHGEDISEDLNIKYFFGWNND